MLEVVTDELEGVAECGNGRETDFLVSLLLAGTLDDCRKNGIGMRDQGSS